MLREDEAKFKIFEALRDMLKHNDIDDIRVTRICERAGVSRRTFYNYFHDIYSVIPWIRKEVMKESVCRIGKDLTWHEGHELMFEQYIKKEMLFKRNLNKYDGYLFVMDILLANVKDKKQSELSKDEFVDLDFYVYAVAHIINKWGDEGMVLSPKRMADICQHYIPEWLVDLFGE